MAKDRVDYGTGYYVRSTAHPLAPDTGLTFEETVEALNTLDAVYEPVESPDPTHATLVDVMATKEQQ